MSPANLDETLTEYLLSYMSHNCCSLVTLFAFNCLFDSLPVRVFNCNLPQQVVDGEYLLHHLLDATLKIHPLFALAQSRRQYTWEDDQQYVHIKHLRVYCPVCPAEKHQVVNCLP